MGLDQGEMALRTGISVKRLSEYEVGRRRCPAGIWKRVCQSLGVELPEVEIWGERQYCRFTKGHKWRVHVDDGPTWFDTPSRNGNHSVVLRRQPDPTFRKLVRTDSPLEALNWSLFCEAGFRPALISPVRMLFPHYPLVDGQGQTLGIAPCAALVWEAKDCSVLVWPQLWMLGPQGRFRPDGLVLVNRRNHQRWYLLEIDGAHHEPGRDALRDLRLLPSVIRLRSSVVMEHKSVEFLFKELGVSLE